MFWSLQIIDVSHRKWESTFYIKLLSVCVWVLSVTVCVDVPSQHLASIAPEASSVR